MRKGGGGGRLDQPSNSGLRSSVTWTPVLNILPQRRIGIRWESAMLLLICLCLPLSEITMFLFDCLVLTLLPTSTELKNKYI